MVTSILTVLIAGPLPTTYVRIEGDGYLRFAKGTQVMYARQAKLTATAQGLMASDGTLMIPRLVAPVGTTKLNIGMDGTITAELPSGQKQMGRLVIAIFDPKAGFNHVGSYVTTTAKPTLTNPGEWVAGVIRTTPLVAKAKAVTEVSVEKTNTAAQGFATPGLEVTVNKDSQLENDHILLGDIAKIDGDPEIVEKLKVINLGTTPIMGATRGLTAQNIRANILSVVKTLKNVKISVPDGATVGRKCQKIEPSAINDAVSQAFKAKFSFETQLQDKNHLFAFFVKPGALAMQVGQLSLNGTQLTGVVEVTVDNQLTNTVRVVYEMPTVSMVKRGDVVRLRLTSNAAMVEVSAKATSNGYLGQSITVQTDNGTTHTGTLVGPNTVVVKL